MACETTSTLPIILLAAGASTRMRGRDKLLEVIDGEPLVRRQARRARAATRGDVIVALPTPPHARHAAVEGCDVTRLPVAEAARGISESLKTGIRALPDDAPAVMVLLADLPEITTQDIAEVLASVDRAPENLIWRGTTASGQAGHPIVFAASLFPALLQVSGDSGGASVIAAHRDRVCHVTLPAEHALRDLDTPEDWETWRAGKRASDH